LPEDVDAFLEKEHDVPNIAALPAIVIKAEELPPFPITAIVGQTHLKKAVLLALANPAISSVLLIGDGETGKSTAIQTGKTMIPEEVPFLEMPLNVTKIQLFGGKTKADGKEVEVTGLVDQAAGGYLFIGRFNLFDDGTIGKMLASAKKKGFTLLATANLEDGGFPEEFDDELDLRVDVSSLTDIEERIEILKRLEGYRRDPKVFYQTYKGREDNLRKRVEKARKIVKSVEFSKQSQKKITSVCKKLNKTEREEAVMKAMAANAALEGRAWASGEDLTEILPLVCGKELK